MSESQQEDPQSNRLRDSKIPVKGPVKMYIENRFFIAFILIFGKIQMILNIKSIPYSSFTFLHEKVKADLVKIVLDTVVISY